MTAILVVDNSPTVRAELVTALERVGHQVIACDSLNAARTALRTQPIGLAIIGTELVDGGGLELVEQIRHDHLLAVMPVLILGNFDDLAMRESGLGLAAADHIGKPFDATKLLARVQHHVGTAGPNAIASERVVAKRILAADDDADFLALMAIGMRKRGYEVTTESSGEAAIARLEQGAMFDIILLDRQMPGLDGLGTCKVVKSKPATRDIPLMILTSLEAREAVIESLGAGADDFVSKKSGLDVLAARVQAQLRRKHYEDEQLRTREQLLKSEIEAAEARAAKEIAETRGRLADELARTNAELSQANRELEAFSYSVSHDLRAPLRTISAFTQALAEDLGERLDDQTRDHVRRVLAASSRMSDLIDALLELARINQAPVARYRVNLSTVGAAILEDLQKRDPQRAVTITIAPDLVVSADGRLMRVLLDNVLGNAWKFTQHTETAHIELGMANEGDDSVFFVRDNGAGFAMEEAERLFTPFHRLHAEVEYGGTGIGLATVRRIVERHGGRIWAQGAVGAGATIRFTIPPERRQD